MPHWHLGGGLPVNYGYVLVQALNLVELADFFREDVHDHVAVVQQHPLLFRHAFATQQRTVGLFTNLGCDLVSNGAQLTRVTGAHHHEHFSNSQDVANIKHDDVAALLVIGGARRDGGNYRGIGFVHSFHHCVIHLAQP